MKIGDKVGFKVDYVNGGDQVVGTVEDIYENISRNIVIVKDAKKNLHKVREEDVIVFSEEPVEEESSEEKRDPGEDMITISRKDFQVIGAEVTNPRTFKCDPTSALSMGLLGVLICSRLEKALFDGGDNA